MQLIADWALRHHIAPRALAELLQLFNIAHGVTVNTTGNDSEAAAQKEIRLAAAQSGARLWRNNNGACKAEDGRQIRFGLGNDSSKVSKVFKSSDLIGITPRMVGPQDVGKVFGLFTAVEVKKPGWSYKGTDREEAQLAFITFIAAHGGLAQFATGKGDL